MSTIDDVALINFPLHTRDDGALAVMEGAGLPFVVKRIFLVRAARNAERGLHAHKRCSQLMVCVSGSIELMCDDGANKRTILLNSIGTGAFVPMSIWASELYMEPQSVLMVSCDRAYEEEDYIRDYEEFLRYRGLPASGKRLS